MNTLRDLLGMNPLRPFIAFGGDDAGGGGGGGGSSSSSSSSTKTNQDRINEIYAASDDPWGSNGAELNELVNDRSGTYSGGSTTTTTSSSNNDKPAPQSQAKKTPSPAPAPTVVKTGTTLKTGTVLNSKDDPVVFTPKDDGGYIGQNQSTLPAAEPATFGDAFAENRAAGNETFTYNGNLYTTELASETPVNEVRTLPSGTEYYVDASGQFAGLVPDSTPASSVSYDAFGNAYDTPAAAAQADQVAEAQSAAAQNAITSASNAALDPRGDQIQSPTSNGAGIASLGEDDVMSQPVVTSASQEYLDSLPDFSYDFTADDAGSPLPDSSQVAGGDWEEYFKNASTQDILNTAGSNVTLPVTPDATPSYDAFGNEYATAEEAAAADLSAEAAASNYGTMSQQDFVDQYATDDAAGISDVLKYAAIVGPENVGNMLSGMGRQSQITSPLNIVPTTGREVGINALIPYLTNQFGTLLMSEEDKRARMLAADPNRAASLTSQGLQDVGGYLSETVSPAIRNYLQPESGQAVFQGDLGGPLTVTDLSGNQLTGSQARQGIANTTAGEVSDTALDIALSANPITRTISAALNAGEQLTGLEQGISSNIDEAYVSGALDGNATFQKALKAQGGDVDKALGVIKDLAYVSGDIPAYQQVAASGAVDAVLPKVGKGVLGFGKEIAKRGAVEGGQGAFESYTAINAINQALGTDFDPTKNIVGAAATEGVAGTGAATVGSAVAQGLSARQRRDALDEAAVMSQPVVAPYGGMDTSGITPGFKQGRSSSSAGSPGTIEGQFTVYDPNLSPTAGEPASSTVSTAYDLEGPEAGLALTDQRDPMTTSMEAMAAQEIINDQVNQTGTVDFGILQRIQNATGLSMNELGTMVESATSTKLTPDQIAAIESAPVGDVMTNVPVAPGFDDEVTGNFGGSNISVRPNPDGTTTLTAPSGRISVVEPGQDLDQAIKVFDEIVTPIDVQTDAPVLQSSGQGLAAPDFTAAPFASTNIGGLSSLGLPSGADLTPAVDTSSGRDVITSKMDSDNTFAEVSDAQAVANAEAIKAQEVAYTETKAATGSDSAAEAAGEAAYNSSIAASSVTETDDGGAEVEIADNLFEAANKADQDVVTVNADGTATVAVDPNAVETGTDVAVVPETTTDVTTDTDGTTDVVVDGTTDLTTAATTDLTVDGDTDTDTDTTAVTVVDDAIEGTATEISGSLTDQTPDTDTKTTVVPVVDNDISMLTEIEPPDEEEEVQVDVEDEVKPGGDVTVDLDEDDTFVSVITSTDENGETITECPEGYTMVEGPDGPMCQKSVTATRQRAGAGTRAYTGLAGNIGRVGPGQRRKTTTSTERVRPTVRSA